MMPMNQASRLIMAGTMFAMLAACGGKERPRADVAASQVTTIGVNSFLWRASLDALSFMPLLQADSAGGVIITDWYANPSNPNERMKVTVSILDRDLRADALRVAASPSTFAPDRRNTAIKTTSALFDLVDRGLTRTTVPLTHPPAFAASALRRASTSLRCFGMALKKSS